MNCLVEHCQNAHDWKAIPCSFDNCNFVAYNRKSIATHKSTFHSTFLNVRGKEFPCTWKKCTSSYSSQKDLERHLQIHESDLLQCVFCPYRTNLMYDMKCHYRYHFKSFDVKCENCGKKFIDKRSLNLHYNAEHSGETYTCHICKKYSGPRAKLYWHIRHTHDLHCKWNGTKKVFETFTNA